MSPAGVGGQPRLPVCAAPRMHSTSTLQGTCCFNPTTLSLGSQDPSQSLNFTRDHHFPQKVLPFADVSRL